MRIAKKYKNEQEAEILQNKCDGLIDFLDKDETRTKT